MTAENSTVIKVCLRCGIAKPLTAFHKARRATGCRPARGGMGVAARCKQCKAERRSPGITQRRAAEQAKRLELGAAGLKCCAKCAEHKDLDAFHKNAAAADGLAWKCKSCVCADSETWRQKNPNAHKEWYVENREKRSTDFAKWRSENKERCAQNYAEWSKSNTEKINALVAKRNAAKLRATPTWADFEKIEAVYAEAIRRTRETGVRYEVDHIVPLQGRTVRGLHWEGNLQVLPKAENISKLNRYWPDMPT